MSLVIFNIKGHLFIGQIMPKSVIKVKNIKNPLQEIRITGIIFIIKPVTINNSKNTISIFGSLHFERIWYL